MKTQTGGLESGGSYEHKFRTSRLEWLLLGLRNTFPGAIFRLDPPFMSYGGPKGSPSGLCLGPRWCFIPPNRGFRPRVVCAAKPKSNELPCKACSDSVSVPDLNPANQLFSVVITLGNDLNMPLNSISMVCCCPERGEDDSRSTGSGPPATECMICKSSLLRPAPLLMPTSLSPERLPARLSGPRDVECTTF